MADTERTEATLLTTLFQDGQGAGAITANDIRDLIVSLTPSQGSLIRNVAAATTITVSGTYYKAAGTTTASAILVGITMPVDNRLVYTGVPDKRFTFTATCSFTVSGSNQFVGLKLAKNGVVIDGTVVRRKVGVGADLGAVALVGGVIMSTNDYIELWVTNETSTGAVTLAEFHLHALGFTAVS